MHNVDEIGLTTGESKDPEITTLCNLTKEAVGVVDEAVYSITKKQIVDI